MAMVVKNNIAAQNALGELNKNISKLGEALAKVSSGMKINSAKDDSAQFAISEVMRVRIRALSQAMQNVQNGNSLLRTAEEGIQQQIDIMRTIKEKVINAANDHNTDTDRKIIQKEIGQFYDQIEQTAYYTDYNLQKPLIANTKFNEKITEWDKVIPGGDYVGKRVTEWIPNLTDDGKAKIVENSDSLNLIDIDNIVDEELAFLEDGRPYVENGGPFDKFIQIDAATQKTLESLTSTSATKLSTGTYYYMADGSDGVDKIISMDLSAYRSVSELDGLAFSVRDLRGNTTQYVLATDTSKYYAKKDVTANSITVGPQTVNESVFPTAPITLKDSTVRDYKVDNLINISDCTTRADIANKIKFQVSSIFSNVAVSTTDSNKIEFTTQNPTGATAQSINNGITVTGISAVGGEIAIDAESDPLEYTHANVRKNIQTSALSITLTGGKSKKTSQDDSSIVIQEPAKAKGSVTLTADEDKLYYIGNRLIKFVDDSSTETETVSITDPPFNVGDADMTKGTPPRTLVPQNVTVTKVGINSSWSLDLGDYKYKISDGVLTAEAKYDGEAYNRTQTLSSVSYPLSFQYKTNEEMSPGLDTYVSTTAAETADKQPATDGTFAHYDIDLSKYVGNHNTDDLEAVIQKLRNVNFSISNLPNYSLTDSKFLNDITVPTYGNKLDLNNLRTAVENGSDIATALQDLFTSSITAVSVDGETPRVEKISNGIRINAYTFGKEKSNNKGYFYMETRFNPYYHYDIDFKALFENNPDLKMTDLYNKGFMSYCATCPSVHQPNPQWFNFYFTDNNLPPPISVPKPEIDTGEDIKDVPINISEVEDGDYEGLIQAFYSQAAPVLNNINHHMFISGDTKNGIITLYDDRTYYTNPEEVRQGQFGTYGAIISDGYKDTSIPVTEDYYEDAVEHGVLETADRERRLVIQDTDHSDLNITLHIPSTTLKDIFQDWCIENQENKRNVWEYNLARKEDREALLSDDTKKRQGAIDSALDYLLNAAVLVGAQRSRLEFAGTNLVTQVENEISSESTIRDADMAKEMAEYTKANVLTQSAQAMLAQANQNSSGVLSLLQ